MYWSFQGSSNHPKVAQQEVEALTNLAAGLLEFERAYCSTHGERTPVFRLLSIINEAIAYNTHTIQDHLIAHPYVEDRQESKSDIPF